MAEACSFKCAVCSATVKRCASLHTTMGGVAPVDAGQPRGRVLQHGLLAGERQQLLRIHFARQRPEPGAGAARQNHRNRWCSLDSRRMLPSADGIVAEARSRHLLGIVEIASVEYHRRAQRALDVIEIGTAKLLPFGDDGECIGALRAPRERSCTGSDRRARRKSWRHSGMATGS